MPDRRVQSPDNWLPFCTQSLEENEEEEEEDMAIRVKRTIGSPTAHPSRLSVTLQTVQTEIFSTVIRAFISFERKWFDLMSQSSALEVVAYLILGIVSTFFIIFIPLAFIFKAFALPLKTLTRTSDDDGAIIEKRSLNEDEAHLDFTLPDWMTQMESWAQSHKLSEKRYRCCFYPDAEPRGLARCFPLLAKYLYPWNSPCSKENNYRDITIDQQYKIN